MARRAAPVGAPKEPPGSAEHRRRLEALRDALTAAVAGAGNRDLAPLAGQLRAVLSDLAALPDVTEASDVDDLASKRARRRSAASAS
jgi:hypothetical protein